MSESEPKIINAFCENIATYPFKTRISKEVNCHGGRADIVLPDYDVVIEAKGSNGSAKSAIGQARWYGSIMDMDAYVLLPMDNIDHATKQVCEDANVGIVTTAPTMLNFTVIHDVGGWESFHPKNMNVRDNPFEDTADFENAETIVVGGVDDE